MKLSDYFPEQFEGWETAGEPNKNTMQPMVPNDQTANTPYLRAAIPLTFQYQMDTVKQWNTMGLSNFRVAPIGPNGIAAQNAAAQSAVTSIINNSSSSSSTTTTYTPCIGVNYHTGDVSSGPLYYTVQLTDLNDLLSFNNPEGGVITLPGGPTGGFSFVQAAYGGGEGPDSSVAITNTPGNGMIAVVFTSPNVTLGPITVYDSAGNDWIPVTTNSSNGNITAIFYCAKIAGGANTVTTNVSFTPPTPPPAQYPFFSPMQVFEFSGMLPGGLDQFDNGLGSGGASISPSKSSTFGFATFQTSSITPGQNPTAGAGFTGAPSQPNTSWNYPAYDGGTLGGYFTGLGEYEANLAAGVTVTALATGGAVSGCNVTFANFQVGPNTPATGFTTCWYTYIENTGTGTFILESAALIDSQQQSVEIGPNQGLLVVYDGTNWATMRGISPNSNITLPLPIADGGTGTSTPGLVAGTNITITGAWPDQMIAASSSSGAAIPLWNYPPFTNVRNSNQTVGWNDGVTLGGTQNATYMVPFNIDQQITASFLKFFVTTTGGSSNFYDLGIYNSSGTLLANIGATHLNTLGPASQAFTQGSVTFTPGMYWFAITSNRSSGALFAFSGVDPFIFPTSPGGQDTMWVYCFQTTGVFGGPSWFQPASGGTTTGGALNSSVTPATLSSSFIIDTYTFAGQGPGVPYVWPRFALSTF